VLAAVFSALHLLTLALGLSAVVARGRSLRALAAGDGQAVRRVLRADGLWGLAALLWLSTGLVRLFGGLDKSPDYYFFNGFFWLKMSLFTLIVLLEIVPMATFIRWRAAVKRGAGPDLRGLSGVIRINDVETALVLLLPFVAAAMARGLWLTT
jgi:putative membrane protein